MMDDSQAMRVAAIDPIDSESCALWYGAEYVLHPPEPVTTPLDSKTAVGWVPSSTDCRPPRPLL